MISLHHGWGWQPTQTASCIHIRHIQSVWAQWYAAHGHVAVAQIWGFWVTCGVKMMPLRHGWGLQPPQTASQIHVSHIQSVWAHWCAVHGLYPPYLAHILGFGSLVDSKWCHYIMVEADSHLKLLPASSLDVYKVFEHIDMLSMGIWQ